MTPDTFLQLSDPLPEPTLLVSAAGTVLAANRAARDGLGVPPDALLGRRLAEAVAEPAAEVDKYLRACGRSRQMVLGSLTLLGGVPLACRAEGAVVRPAGEGVGALVLLRLLPKPSVAGGFVALNRRIDELGREVHRRRATEEALRRQEEWLRVTLASIGDAVVATDAGGRVTFLNPVAEHLTGWPRAEALTRPLPDVFHIVNEGTREPVENPALRALKDGVIVGLANHTVLIARDGTERPIDDSAAPIRDETGAVHGAVLVFRDVTDRRHEEEARARLAAIVESSDDAIISKTLDGTITSWNAGAERLYGWTAAEAVGRPITLVIPPDRLDEERAILDRIRRGERVHHFETVRVARGGGRIDISLTVSPIVDAAGRPVGASKIVRDVTGRKRAEIALRESEARFRQLADAMPQIVWTAGPDGQIDYLNRRWAEFSGEPAAGNAGWGPLLHPDEGPTAAERWAAAVRSGEPFEMELRLRDRRDGGYRWHLIRTVGVRDEAGAVARWFGTATDIDGQKRAGEAYRYLAAASAALAGVVDYESTLQKVANLAVPYFADWSAVDVAGDDGSLRRLAVAHRDAEKVALVREIMRAYPPDPDAPGGAHAVLRSRQPQLTAEITDDMLVRSARDERHLDLIRSLGLRSYICVPLVVSGAAFGVLTFATAESGRTYTDADLALAVDLAQRAGVAVENTHLYKALKDADRRKDEFLATLAHELRNPLAPIRNGLQVIRLSDAPAVRGRAQEMMDRQLSHMVRLVDDLLDVSRITRNKMELRRERVPLADVVGSAVEAARPAIDAAGHELTVSLPARPVALDADPTRLSQVFSNLLGNSAKYTPPGGRVWLSAERTAAGVAVTVRDTGIGIPAASLPTIFDMFSQVDRSVERTTGGLGIGLALVKGLVEMHGGTVAAHSGGEGRGSSFTVTLPVAADPAEPAAGPPGVGRPGSSAGRRVLVVDDNRDGAESLSQMLLLCGHDVRTAHDGLEAVAAAAAFRPEVILMDVGMPRLNGLDATRRIREQPWGRGVRIVALSGWGQEADRERSRRAGCDGHLVKPVDPADLEKLLAELAG